MENSLFFFFNDTATTEIYTLSLHYALPISSVQPAACIAFKSSSSTNSTRVMQAQGALSARPAAVRQWHRSEEHTSELQTPCNLVCRLLLEKKKYLSCAHRQQCHRRRTL